MPAYVIVTVTVHNPEGYEDYKKLTPATIATFGGRFVVRGGAVEVLEGDQVPERVVVLEFKDVDTAKAWWHSEEYGAAKVIRQRNATTQMIVVEGVAT